jgi:hypothetical protein
LFLNGDTADDRLESLALVTATLQEARLYELKRLGGVVGANAA